MTRKVYRNALRSRTMIRQAFISLLKEKPLNRITVVDVVQRADLSRNTFYAHYQDVYAILEEIQQESIDALNAALDEAISLQTWQPEPLLEQIARYIDDNRELFRLLFDANAYQRLIPELKQVVHSRILACSDSLGVQDIESFSLFMEVMSSGFLSLVHRFLNDETAPGTDAIVREMSRLTLAALPLYR